MPKCQNFQFRLTKKNANCGKKSENSVENVSAVLKCRLKQTFFVENETLKCVKNKETRRY